MGKCSSCGRTAGLKRTLCTICEGLPSAQTANAELSDIAAERARNRERVAEGRKQELESLIADVHGRIERAGHVCLYQSIYLPVDSVVLDETLAESFDISPLQSLGLLGWEVIATVPRTVGVGMNTVSVGSTVGRTLGGGLGGDVAGVHIILQKRLVGPITPAIEAEIRANVDRYLATPPKLPNRY